MPKIALDAAKKQFAFYEQQHSAKIPPNTEKAEVNGKWAEECHIAASAFRRYYVGP